MKRSAAQDQKATQDDEEDLESEGNQVPQEKQGLRANLGQRDFLVNMDLEDLKDPRVSKGIPECRVTLVPRDLEASPVTKAPKVSRASPSRLLLCCSRLLQQQSMKVRQPSLNVQWMVIHLHWSRGLS